MKLERSIDSSQSAHLLLNRYVALLFTFFLFAAATPAFAADGGLAAQGAFSSNGFAGGVFVTAICDVFSLVQGSLGGMLTSAAALSALVAAALGSKAQFMSVVVVAVGAFAISSGVSLYFGSFNC